MYKHLKKKINAITGNVILSQKFTKSLTYKKMSLSPIYTNWFRCLIKIFHFFFIIMARLGDKINLIFLDSLSSDRLYIFFKNLK